MVEVSGPRSLPGVRHKIGAVVFAGIDRHMRNFTGGNMLENDQRTDGDLLVRHEIVSIRILCKADPAALPEDTHAFAALLYELAERGLSGCGTLPVSIPLMFGR